MKPPVTPVGWMELLDREEGWTWGQTYRLFDGSIDFYLKAINTLRRHLTRADATGEWRAAYRFWRAYRCKTNYDRLPSDRKERLHALPYFFSSMRELKYAKVLSDILKFKGTLGRLPQRSIPEEKQLYEKHKRMVQLARLGKLTESHIIRMTEYGVLPLSRKNKNRENLKDLELFVKTHKRWPIYNGREGIERKLYRFMKYISYEYRRNNRYRTIHEDLLSMPGCPYKAPTTCKKGTHK